MQSNATNTAVRSSPSTNSSSSPPTPTQPNMTIEKLERLAFARLQHTVNELQIQVDMDRKSVAPKRTVFCCVCDDTALTASITDLKTLVGKKSIKIIVPLATLDALDHLKKGAEDVNIHARESIRYFDRVQSSRGQKPITGVCMQSPTERYATWEECLAAAPEDLRPHDIGDEEPPTDVKNLLNCAIYAINHTPDANSTQDIKVYLVSNNEQVRGWAALYKTPAISTDDVIRMVHREDIEFEERRRHYDYEQSSPTRSRGGGGANMARRSRGGGYGGGGGRGRWRDESRNDFAGGGRNDGRTSPEFVLRGAPRGVARGRGRLWEP